ncbi:MAG: carboxypeptidase regulatory-like domain-containing protein [Chitinispirillaceae bacterium]|nr:carboxypeptidase regulatory-like domain-containing protein [Chitinispirillaceae bacterium]
MFSAGCSNDTGNNPTSGVISGTVMKAIDSSAIASANVTVFNANTNAPVLRILTDLQGQYRLEVVPGTYYLKVAAQGYKPSPPADGAPLPFEVTANDPLIQNTYLRSDPAAVSTGSVSGTVISGTSGIGGALVIALRTTDSIAFSGVSGPAGFYVLYNLPAGTYRIQCYLAGYMQSPDTSLTVAPNTAITDFNLHLEGASVTRLTGKITFLASQNSQVDITLIHPVTRDAIPGLNTTSDATLNYSLAGIPPGTSIAWASYRNDGYVMDPDWIRKNGLPLVTFDATDTLITLNFSVTGAITIVSPTNSADSVFSVPVSTSRPVFVWTAYPSAKEYIIEVNDRHGNVIWGGFDALGVSRLRTQILQQQTSVTFNFDSSAFDTLKSGESYRWKVFADNDAGPNVQGLISASEDLRGLFTVALP